GAIPPSTRGRHGPGRLHYGAPEIADIITACASPAYANASATVRRFADHVADEASPIARVNLRDWLISTLRGFAAMTPAHPPAALEQNGLLEFTVNPYDPNPYTASARIEWGRPDCRQAVTFRWRDHAAWPLDWQVLGEQPRAASFAFTFRTDFRLLVG